MLELLRYFDVSNYVKILNQLILFN